MTMKRAIFTITLGVAVVCSSISAAERLPDISYSEVTQRSEAAENKGNVLTALNELRALATVYAAESDSKSSYRTISQIILNFCSRVGAYKEALRMADVGRENWKTLT